MKPVVTNSESDWKLISDFLFEAGCCRVCVLRFLDPNIDDFLDVEKSLKSVNKVENKLSITLLKSKVIIEKHHQLQ